MNERLVKFLEYVALLKGDEKSEAQVFLDRLFQAFGHGGYKEAGATLEDRVKTTSNAQRFVDLTWRPRVLIEMKKRGQKLERHYAQAFEYWIYLVPNRPRYVVLCNFDEFWIYDFDQQVDQPMDKVLLSELPSRYTALAFLMVGNREPQFRNNLVSVTKAAAEHVAQIYQRMIARGENRSSAQRFILQSVACMYSEDAGLLPKGLFTSLVKSCGEGKDSSYDLLGGLFRQMDSERPARAGRYQNVPYFNGGLFGTVDPIELADAELLMMSKACNEDWSRVRPEIFGAIFQKSMDEQVRHAHGAHFTSEADIQKIVGPTISRPFQANLDDAKTLKELIALLSRLRSFRVLDPACGSGNFLYVAYRELKRLESATLERIYTEFRDTAPATLGTQSHVSLSQFYGIDIDPFAVELTKVTLMIAKELALLEADSQYKAHQASLELHESPLPLENLDSNILCQDAILQPWPDVDAIIGNPPYQSKNKIQQEFGPNYVTSVRRAYPSIPGRADFCVWWFRKAHDHLKPGQRAGLVGTNTVRQNYSREGGLDYIVENGGTITDAVGTQRWSGEAALSVAIVNWIKGSVPGPYRLMWQTADALNAPWDTALLSRIPSSLSADVDVTKAKALKANKTSGLCAQGQTHGHDAFLLEPSVAKEMIRADPKYGNVLFPYMTVNDLLSTNPPQPKRYSIDFHPMDVVEASTYSRAFKQLELHVLPERKKKIVAESKRNMKLTDSTGNKHHSQFLKKWWLMSWPRAKLIQKIEGLPRYIVVGQVTLRPIFDFVSPKIRPNAALVVFPLADDYSFGVLQSTVHWTWFTHRCSTLTARPRYTTQTVFDSFPWPQNPTRAQALAIALAAVELRNLRRELMTKHSLTLRKLYRMLDLPGTNALRDATAKLDKAVLAAYGIKSLDDALGSLLALNLELAGLEKMKTPIIGPGLPIKWASEAEFYSSDAVSI